MNTPQEVADAAKKAIHDLEAAIARAEELATTPEQKAKIGAMENHVKALHKKLERLAKEIPDVTIFVGGDGK